MKYHAFEPSEENEFDCAYPGCGNIIEADCHQQPSLTQECIEAGTDWYTPEPGTPTREEAFSVPGDQFLISNEELEGIACSHGVPMTERREQCVNEGVYTYAQPKIIYLDPSTDEVYQWLRLGKCIWCGGECPGDQCRIRHCDSCTQNWLGTEPVDLDDGRPRKEYCPPCQEYLNHTHARNPSKSDHIICGSLIDPEIKVGNDVTCPDCLPVWNQLHLTYQPALLAASGDPIC